MADQESTNFLITIGLGIVALFQPLWLFILRGIGKQVDDNKAEIHRCFSRNDDQFVPRRECERTHENLDGRLDRVEDGITGIHKRLDKVIGKEDKH